MRRLVLAILVLVGLAATPGPPAHGIPLSTVVPFDFFFSVPVLGVTPFYPLAYVVLPQFDPALGVLDDAVLTVHVAGASLTIELVADGSTITGDWVSAMHPPGYPGWFQTGGGDPVSTFAACSAMPCSATATLTLDEGAIYSPSPLSGLVGTGSVWLGGVPDFGATVFANFTTGSSVVIFRGSAELIYEYTPAPPQPVSEPSTVALLALGGVSALALRRRRRRSIPP